MATTTHTLTPYRGVEEHHTWCVHVYKVPSKLEEGAASVSEKMAIMMMVLFFLLLYFYKKNYPRIFRIFSLITREFVVFYCFLYGMFNLLVGFWNYFFVFVFILTKSDILSPLLLQLYTLTLLYYNAFCCLIPASYLLGRVRVQAIM